MKAGRVPVCLMMSIALIAWLLRVRVMCYSLGSIPSQGQTDNEARTYCAGAPKLKPVKLFCCACCEEAF